MNKTPRPERRHAVLWNTAEGRPTHHNYVETRPTRLNEPDGSAWEHIFRCAETGTERRYGLEHRRLESWAVEGN